MNEPIDRTALVELFQLLDENPFPRRKVASVKHYSNGTTEAYDADGVHVFILRTEDWEAWQAHVSNESLGDPVEMTGMPGICNPDDRRPLTAEDVQAGAWPGPTLAESTTDASSTVENETNLESPREPPGA